MVPGRPGRAGSGAPHLDSGDGSLHVQPAAAAPGFPGRSFVVDLDQATIPVEVRVFGDGGRAIVT